MRIKSAHLQNIRSHKDTTINFERLTTITGLNHSGKSSLENSIELAFARRSEVTGAGGQGQTDLLRFGQDLGSVELDIDLDGIPVELRASLTRRSGLNVTLRNPTDKDWSPVALAADMKADQDVLSCLCNNRFFIDMKPADQKSLLASIILPANYDWPENIKSDLHACIIQPDWSKGPFAIIEACYDAAFKQRTNVNRDIKNWRAPQDGGKYDGPPIEDVRHLLTVRQNERTESAVEQQRLKGAIDQKKAKKENYERKATEAEAKIVTEKAERERIAGESLSKAAVKKLETEAAGAVQAASLDAAIAARAPEIASAKRQYDAVLGLGMTPKCPTCSQAITEDFIESLAAPIASRQLKLEEEQIADYEKRKSLGDPAGAQKKLDAHNSVEKDLAQIDKRIADLERTVAEATANAAGINPDELPKPDSLDEKIAQLDERIQKGTSFLEAAARAESAKAETAKAMKKKAELDEEIARLERLITYFGPKGVKCELITQHIGSFEQGINANLAKWGYACSLSIEPWSFEVRRLDSPYACQLHMLSRSEKLRFANAFVVALAIVSGWGFVVLDDSETIIGDDSVELLKMLYTSDLDQAILLMATVEERTASKPGTAFVALDETLEDGISTTHVRVLESTPA